MWTVYILQSQINYSYYVGSTSDVNRRIKEHNAGHTPSTKNLIPLTIRFSQEYPTLKYARKVESWLKSTHSKVVIEQIILDGKINKKF
ncbi:GIY-YIG nuclease family protein [Candidatus Woesebacteria bacterium]|nr:GIY-YIG nuclease family protein [Candidatus Woesebacteria bacterium]